MAAAGSWESIQEHGLLSTTELVRLWGVAPPAVRDSLTQQRRPESVVILNSVFGRAEIRDQKPIHEPSLAMALDGGMEPREWYELLNQRVFFFLQPERLQTLLNARSYRHLEHDVIEVDTEALVLRHEAEIELCAINSGFAQPHSRARRGVGTFKSIAKYDHPTRLVPRLRSPWDVAELCVREGVRDISDIAVSVVRFRGAERIQRLG